MAYVDYKTVSRVLKTTYVTQPYHINGAYGYGYDHWGIDLVCYNGYGTCLGDIFAHSAGIVIGTRNDCRGYESGSYGNYVLIEHNNGMRTMYAHCAYDSVSVSVGQYVAEGQRIAYMGNTGESFGGHLHFEIRTKENYKIDPTPLLNAPLHNTIPVNGIADETFIKKLQEILKVDYNYIVVDGMISHQLSGTEKYVVSKDPSVWEYDHTKIGSLTIKAVQEVLRSYGLYDDHLDGLLGYNSALGIQKFINMFGYDIDEDGILGFESFSAWAKFLNSLYV